LKRDLKMLHGADVYTVGLEMERTSMIGLKRYMDASVGSVTLKGKRNGWVGS
jgi:hypothetical protein